MSYASSRNPLIRGLKSVNIGESIQEQSPIETLVSGVASPLIDFTYPDGIWSGWAQIEVIGDNTTALTYLNIIEDNEGGTVNQLQSYFVNTTLPDNNTYFIKYPITRWSFEDPENEIILSAQAVFAGTAPTVQIIYLYLIKIG